jgi:hypothetical protein
MVTKEKNIKIRRLTNINFCDKYGHAKSKCFKKMKALEATMKKHTISIDSTTSSSSHGHALCSSGFSFNRTSTSSFDE